MNEVENVLIYIKSNGYKSEIAQIKKCKEYAKDHNLNVIATCFSDVEINRQLEAGAADTILAAKKSLVDEEYTGVKFLFVND